MPLSLALDVFGVMYMTLSKTYFVKEIQVGILIYLLEEIVSWQHKSWRESGHKSQMGQGLCPKRAVERVSQDFSSKGKHVIKHEDRVLVTACIVFIKYWLVCRAGGLMRAPLECPSSRQSQRQRVRTHNTWISPTPLECFFFFWNVATQKMNMSHNAVNFKSHIFRALFFVPDLSSADTHDQLST